MTFKFVKQRTVKIGTVEGDVSITNCQEIVPENGQEIVITGTLSIKGDVIFAGSLRAHGIVGKAKKVIIEGDLTVENTCSIEKCNMQVMGNAKAGKFVLGSSLTVRQDLECSSARVGGSIKVHGDVKAGRLDVGGAIRIDGDVEVQRINVGGSVKLLRKVNMEELSVGGAGTVNTGRIGRVSIGGSFRSEDSVEIEDINVGGSVKVGPDSSIDSIDVGGSFKARGNLKFGSIDVGGSVSIEGNGEGESIDVGGKVRVDGSLALSGSLDVGGKVGVDGDLNVERKISIGGTLTVGGNISTTKLSVGGSIEAMRIKATETFQIGKRGTVTGFVEAGDILIRERAETDSLYGDRIRVEERARAKNLYGREIYIERNAEVDGTITYVDRIEIEKDAKIKTDPVKVESLPPPDECR